MRRSSSSSASTAATAAGAGVVAGAASASAATATSVTSPRARMRSISAPQCKNSCRTDGRTSSTQRRSHAAENDHVACGGAAPARSNSGASLASTSLAASSGVGSASTPSSRMRSRAACGTCPRSSAHTCVWHISTTHTGSCWYSSISAVNSACTPAEPSKPLVDSN